MPFALRWGPAATRTAWLTWLLVCAVLIWRPFQFHIDYFSSPGPQFRPAILVVLPLVLGLALAYAAVRTERVRRLELLAPLLALPFVVIKGEYAAVGVVGLMLVSSFALGRLFQRLWGGESAGRVAHMTLACGLGLAIWMVSLTFLGALGLFRPWVFGLLLAAPLAVRLRAVPEIWAALRSIWRDWAADEDLASPLTAISVVFGVMFFMQTAMVALTPSISYDAIAMHLPEVRHYLAVGGLQPVPGLEYSFYPQGHEMILTLAAGLAGQPGAQLAGLLFFALSLGATYAIARQLGAGRGAACLAAFVAATIPFLHWTGSVVKNDFSLGFFQLCSFYCLLLLRRSLCPGLFGVGAFFLGSAFAVKHVALFGAIPLGLLYLWQVRRVSRPWLTTGLMAGLLALPPVFWYGRAYVERGSPVYPSHMRSTVRALPSIGGKRFSRATLWLRYPWVAHFDGKTIFESPSPNPYGFALFLLLPAWLLVRRKESSPEERAALVYLGVYYAYWTYVWGVGRYGLPFIYVLTALTMPRVWALYGAGGAAVRWGTRVGVAGVSAFAMLVALIIEVNLPQILYLTGSLDRSGYLEKALNGYSSLEFLGGVVRPGDHVLSLDNCARAYAPDPSNFICLGIPWWRAETAPGRLADEMDRRRFDYLLLPSAETGAAVLARLEQDWALAPLYKGETSTVYRVEGPAAKGEGR